MAIDTVPPAVTAIGTVAGDNVVSSADNPGAGIAVTGVVNEPNADVRVTWGGRVANDKADGAGNWSAVFASGNLPADGTHTVSAVARDAAGNESAPFAGPAAITVDVTPPPLIVGPVAGDDIINAQEGLSGATFSGTTDSRLT